MTSTSQYLSYTDSTGIVHKFRKVAIKELYATCAHNKKRQAQPNCFKFPMPAEPLDSETIVRLHRFYKIFQNSDFKDEQYLCSLASVHGMKELSKLFDSILCTKQLSYPPILRIVLNNLNPRNFLGYEFLRYEQRLCWLRALITNQPYQLLVPELFGRDEEKSE